MLVLVEHLLFHRATTTSKDGFLLSVYLELVELPHDVLSNLLLVFLNISIRFSLIGWHFNFQ